MTLGRDLARIREARGFSRRELARAANVSEATVRRIEAGASRSSLDVIERIAYALGADLAELHWYRELVVCARWPADIDAVYAYRTAPAVAVGG